MVKATRRIPLAAGVALILAGRLLAQATPPFGAIGPLPAPAPASTFDVYEKSIVELLAAQRIGTVTSHDLVEKYLARIKAYDQAGPRLNAMIALNPRALEEADALDAERRAGRVRGPLHGIPIVVKDNYTTADMPTTAGSRALLGFQAGRDAFMVRKLKDAGAVIIGKTNLHELAYGITTISSAGGQTRNPYDPTRNPGGSSGGTGAAVAASFAAAGMAAIRVARSAIPLRKTTCSDSAARPGCRAGTALCRWHIPRTSAARLRDRSPTCS